MNKQSTINPSNKTRHTKFLSVVLFVLAFAVFIVYLFYGQTYFKVKTLNSQLDEVTVPSDWRLKNSINTPSTFWGSCLSYSDVTCPTVGKTYLVPSSKAKALSEMSQLLIQLRSSGYHQKAACLTDSCVYYSFSVTKDGYAVGALAHESEGNRFVHLGISKD